uniref:Uncharacterized protein n=1 Tax=Arundo donax TaxID=35708 RepID=A0A0A9BE84_ARUDO
MQVELKDCCDRPSCSS